jgi:hypothetical protein
VERVGNRNRGTLRFARDVRGEVDEGARGAVQNGGSGREGVLYGNVPAVNDGTRRHAPVAEPLRTESAGVAGLENPIRLDVQLDVVTRAAAA